MRRRKIDSSIVSEDSDMMEEDDTESDYRSPDEGYTSQEGTLRAKRLAMRKNSEKDKQLGVTLDGLRVFPLPETPSHLESLFAKWYSVPSLLAWCGILFSFLVFARYSGHPSTILSIAVFWRLCYNLGLGLMLKNQSESGLITRWVIGVREKPFSRENSMLSWILKSTMPGNREVLDDNTLPASFPAWIAFRSIVNIVESNDVVAFTLTAIQYGLIERSKRDQTFLFHVLSPVADIIGLLLICLSLYSKVEARRKAGDYAWYWGDFFFLRIGNVELSFDGVFELFPHPMYTVGYGWTYGCAMLARSFSVLACGMAFHLSQLLFLTLVEVPHVEKLYGPSYLNTGRVGYEKSQRHPVTAMEEVPEEAEVCEPSFVLPSSVLAEKETAPVEASLPVRGEQVMKSNVFVIKNFDLFRASDVNLALSLVFFILSVVFGSHPGGPLDDDGFFILQAVFWHVVSAVAKAFILVQQEKTKFWTRHFLRNGLGRQAAFESWKSLFNMLQSLQLISFLLCAFRLLWVPPTWSEWFRPEYISQIMSGLMLIMISMWSFSSCYEVLGDYGWFYGDFFLPPPSLHRKSKKVPQQGDTETFPPGTLGDVKIPEVTRPSRQAEEDVGAESSQPTYEGIYRYLNNPDAYLGHLWMYGMSLLCSSPELFVVALLAHGMKIAFLQTVEKPHFRQVYKQHVRKSSTALGRAISGKVSDIKRNETAMFLANWVKHPIETGALAPSSEYLARAMCDTMDLGDNSVVIELGPGTGPFTKEILRRQAQHRNTTYIAFELNDEFISKLKTLFPKHEDCFLKESAENIMQVLKDRNIKHVDTIISGLPWAIFPYSLQEAILDQVYEALRPGGRFCTFAYLQGLVLPAGQNFKALLDKKFYKQVQRSNIVWKNLPPAFVYRCEKVQVDQ